MSKQGKLIVIDGTDGSGKATQTDLLIKRLKKDKVRVKVVDFPDYYSNFFGAFIGHWLNLGRDKRHRFFEASKEFRNAFIEIQRFLRMSLPKDPAHPPEGWQNANKLARKYYVAHYAAVERFKPNLPWHKRNRFTKRWHEYCCYDKESGCETFSDYEPRQNEEEIAKRKLALSRIQKLLGFARV